MPREQKGRKTRKNGRVTRPTEPVGMKEAKRRFQDIVKRLATLKNYRFFLDKEYEYGENVPLLRGGINPRFLLPPNQKRKRFIESDLVDMPDPFDIPSPIPQAPSFVIKLFNRAVNVAQFQSTTSLYPVCRAWVENKPYQMKQAEEDDEPGDKLDVKPFEIFDIRKYEVHQLPPPDPPIYKESSSMSRVKIPAPLLQETEIKDFRIDTEDENTLNPSDLFESHLNRWQAVRRRWKKACWENEKRYDKSFTVLKQIHAGLIPQLQGEIETSGVDEMQ